MPDKPSGFEIDTEDTAELVRAEPLLRRAHQVHCLQPNVHRHVTFLEDGPDLDGKRLAAGIALIDADAGALALQRSRLIEDAAMRTDAAIRPDDVLDVGVGRMLVAEAGIVENGLRHRLSPSQRTYNV